MREHIGLYRGKRKDNGEWVQGAPFFARDCCKMIVAVAVHPDFVDEGNVYYAEGYPVDPDTVGECTGLTDKNGKLIFEGDIVRHHDGSEIVEKGVVFWAEEYCGWHRTTNGAFHRGAVDTYRMSHACVYEIIGNIHDNPKLLGGGEDD